MNQKDRSSPAEGKFEEVREELLNSIDLKRFVEDPFLLLRRQRVAEYLTRMRLYEKIINVPGAIVECGVRKGGNLMLFYHLVSLFEPYAYARKIYGFDTFEGFRSIHVKDGENVHEKMFSDADFEILEKSIAVHDLNRPIGHVPRCELIRGDAVQTIPEFVQARPDLMVALLYLDFDIYEPTVTALKHFLPLVPKGGIVVFDDLNDPRWPGETMAVKEMLDIKRIGLKRFEFDPLPAYYVVGE